MKFLLIIITLFAAFNAYAEHDFVVYPEPLKAPVSLFEDKYGSLKTLGNFQNKVVVLNFWATWCKPCLVEMPALDKLAEINPKVAVVPIVSSKDDVSKVRTFYRRYKFKELEYFIDNQELTAQSYQVVDIPTSFVFDKDGRLVAYVSGVIDWTSPENQAFIKELSDQ